MISKKLKLCSIVLGTILAGCSAYHKPEPPYKEKYSTKIAGKQIDFYSIYLGTFDEDTKLYSLFPMYRDFLAVEQKDGSFFLYEDTWFKIHIQNNNYNYLEYGRVLTNETELVDKIHLYKNGNEVPYKPSYEELKKATSEYLKLARLVRLNLVRLKIGCK